MEECDVETFSALARSLVDSADTLFLCFSEALCNACCSKCDVVDAFASLLDEAGDCAFRAGRFEEFEFGLSDLEESGLYLLVSDFFDCIALEAENVLIVRNGFVKRLDGDSEVFDVSEFHNRFFINNCVFSLVSEVVVNVLNVFVILKFLEKFVESFALVGCEVLHFTVREAVETC